MGNPLDRIQNLEVREAVKQALNYVKGIAVMALIIGLIAFVMALFQLTSDSSDASPVKVLNTAAALEMGVTPTPLSNTEIETPEIQKTSIDQPALETVNYETIEAAVGISYGPYDPLWEYLEYGNSVEYFQPRGTEVLFYLKQQGGGSYYFTTSMNPPELRALMEVFPGSGLSESSGYTANATIENGTVISVNWIADSEGNTVWRPAMRTDPRALNELELWAIDYTTAKGWDWYIVWWFDRLPDCRNQVRYGSVTGNTCEEVRYSPAEIYARSLAFTNYTVDPENNVWVEIWKSVDARYRWIDAISGETLERVDIEADLFELPESGWVALQIGHAGDNGTWQNPEFWETTATVQVGPGSVIAIDQIGYIQTGRVDWDISGELLAWKTEAWSIQKILDWLPPIGETE